MLPPSSPIPPTTKDRRKAKRRLLPIIISAVLAVAVLAGGTVAVIKLIPEREDDTSTPSIEEIKVLDKSSDDFKTVPLPIKAEHISFIEEKKEESSVFVLILCRIKQHR